MSESKGSPKPSGVGSNQKWLMLIFFGPTESKILLVYVCGAIAGELKGIVKKQWKESKLGQENSHFECEKNSNPAFSGKNLCTVKGRIMFFLK